MVQGMLWGVGEIWMDENDGVGGWADQVLEWKG